MGKSRRKNEVSITPITVFWAPNLENNQNLQKSRIEALITQSAPNIGKTASVKIIQHRWNSIGRKAQKRWNSIGKKTSVKTSSIGEKASVKTSSIGEKRLNETQTKILSLLSQNPNSSCASLADQIGISKRNIESNVGKLKAIGFLLRHGPAKGGTWEVVKSNDLPPAWLELLND